MPTPPDDSVSHRPKAQAIAWTALGLTLALAGPVWLAAVAGVGLAWKPMVTYMARASEWLMLLPLLVMLKVRTSHLENTNRQRIAEYLEEHPGASIQEVRRHLDVAWGTAVYHLDRMRREGLLVSHRHGNHHRYWLSHSPQARLRRGWSVLEQPTARDVALAVATSPGLHQSAICDALDMRAPNASKHLTRLEQHGLVAKRRISRFAVYEPTPELEEILRLQGHLPAATPASASRTLTPASSRTSHPSPAAAAAPHQARYGSTPGHVASSGASDAARVPATRDRPPGSMAARPLQSPDAPRPDPSAPVPADARPADDSVPDGPIAAGGPAPAGSPADGDEASGRGEVTTGASTAQDWAGVGRSD